MSKLIILSLAGQQYGRNWFAQGCVCVFYTVCMFQFLLPAALDYLFLRVTRQLDCAEDFLQNKADFRHLSSCLHCQSSASIWPSNPPLRSHFTPSFTKSINLFPPPSASFHLDIYRFSLSSSSCSSFKSQHLSTQIFTVPSQPPLLPPLHVPQPSPTLCILLPIYLLYLLPRLLLFNLLQPVASFPQIFTVPPPPPALPQPLPTFSILLPRYLLFFFLPSLPPLLTPPPPPQPPVTQIFTVPPHQSGFISSTVLPSDSSSAPSSQSQAPDVHSAPSPLTPECCRSSPHCSLTTHLFVFQMWMVSSSTLLCFSACSSRKSKKYLTAGGTTAPKHSTLRKKSSTNCCNVPWRGSTDTVRDGWASSPTGPWLRQLPVMWALVENLSYSDQTIFWWVEGPKIYFTSKRINDIFPGKQKLLL